MNVMYVDGSCDCERMEMLKLKRLHVAFHSDFMATVVENHKRYIV